MNKTFLNRMLCMAGFASAPAQAPTPNPCAGWAYRHVYHYCAERQSQGGTTRIDGVAYCVEKVKDMGHYRDLKSMVSDIGCDAYNGSGWSLTSLSYLGHEWVSTAGPEVPLTATES